MIGLKRLGKLSLATSAAVAALTMLAPGALAQARAQEASANAINVESQDLGSALRALARQTGTQIVFDPAAVRGLSARAVTNAMSPEQALRAMLADTGLRFRATGQGTYTILAQATDERPTRLGAVETAAPSEEEIIVTAQRREERLEDVPISVSVLGGEELDRSTLNVTESLRSVPGVAIGQNVGLAAGTQVSMRGVASADAFLAGSNPVAFYVDSAPFGLVKTAIVPDTGAYDLDRVEVLRGPQGTLYGANALNGVIRVLTHDADLDEFELKARANYGAINDGNETYGGDMALNVPLVEGRLAARLVAGYQDTGGWIDNLEGEDANDGESTNVRLRVRAEPTDNLTLGLFGWSSRYEAGAASIGDDNEMYAGILPQPLSSDFDLAGFTAEYRFSGFTLTSATSYLDFQSSSSIDLSIFDPVNFVQSFLTELQSEVFTQEVGLTSNGSGPLRWSLGAIYRDAEDLLFQNGAIVVAPFNFTDASESYAVFGEVTYATGDWEITGGLRYFEDRVTQRENTPVSGNPADPLYQAEETFDAVTPRIIVAYHPNADSLLYASYSEGFRSGYNQSAIAIAQDPTIPPVDPDTLRNYEIGARGSVANGRIHYDAAVYYLDWENVQQLVQLEIAPGAFAAAGINGESASGVGVDFSVAVEVVEGLQVSTSLSMNDLTLNGPIFSSGIELFSAGDRLNSSPEYTLSGAINYEFALGAPGWDGRFALSGTLTAPQSIAVLFGATPGRIEGDELFIARSSFSVDAPSDWTLTLFAENLFDERGVSAPNNFPPWSSRVRPRTIGVQIEHTF